jgi:hypothetical protein
MQIYIEGHDTEPITQSEVVEYLSKKYLIRHSLSFDGKESVFTLSRRKKEDTNVED